MKARAYTHQMNIKAKLGWQEQDAMKMLHAPDIHFCQDQFFKTVREAVRFSQKGKMPVKQRCSYNNLSLYCPLILSE